jgi:hypothetical protein
MKLFLEKNKGQSAAEFMLLVGAVLFFFIIFLVVVQENSAEKNKERLDFIMKELAFSVRDEINLASSSREGYLRKFKVPEKISYKDYEINLTEDLVYLRTLDGKNAIALPVENVTGDFVKGDNFIWKKEGIVYLNVYPN